MNAALYTSGNAGTAAPLRCAHVSLASAVEMLPLPFRIIDPKLLGMSLDFFFFVFFNDDGRHLLKRRMFPLLQRKRTHLWTSCRSNQSTQPSHHYNDTPNAIACDVMTRCQQFKNYKCKPANSIFKNYLSQVK